MERERASHTMAIVGELEGVQRSASQAARVSVIIVAAPARPMSFSD